jgi:outer membrane biosynthesis protein TonB
MPYIPGSGVRSPMGGNFAFSPQASQPQSIEDVYENFAWAPQDASGEDLPGGYTGMTYDQGLGRVRHYSGTYKPPAAAAPPPPPEVTQGPAPAPDDPKPAPPEPTKIPDTPAPAPAPAPQPAPAPAPPPQAAQGGAMAALERLDAGAGWETPGEPSQIRPGLGQRLNQQQQQVFGGRIY